MITGITITSVSVLRLLKGQISSKKLELELDDISTKEDKINIYFIFRVIYYNSSAKEVAARLYIKGKLEYKETQQYAKEIETKWLRNGAIPTKFMNHIKNYLYFECETRGTLAAYSMDLPPSIPALKVKISER